MEHDNRRVRQYLDDYRSLEEFLTTCPLLGDVLVAASTAKSPGDTARKPLSMARVFELLRSCDHITTRATAQVLAWADYCEATLKRYTQAARTASQFVARELGRTSHTTSD